MHQHCGKEIVIEINRKTVKAIFTTAHAIIKAMQNSHAVLKVTFKANCTLLCEISYFAVTS